MQKPLFATLLSLTLLAQAALADSTIVILRHGEKPATGLGQLNCQGLNRALALPPLLLQRFGKPDKLFAPNPSVQKADHGVPYAYIRPLATIEPLAIQVGMPVDVSWAMTDTDGLAGKLLQLKQGLQVVAWEHHLAVQLAKQLLDKAGGKSDEVPPWANDDFDSLYVVSVSEDDKGQRSARFRIEAQGLNKQSPTCPGPALP
jgi:hypothetical protein